MPEYHIIREVYGQDGLEQFEDELDQALSAQTETIIIEPAKLGLATARWIALGNFLHKSSVLCGMGTCIASLFTNRLSVLTPLGCCSFICAGVYMVSWQFDPCCKYQVETEVGSAGKVDRLPLHHLSSTSPVILVRRDDGRRKMLHNTLALVSISICFYRLYSRYS